MHHEVDAKLNSEIGQVVEIAFESVQFEQHDELLAAPTHRLLDFGDQNFEVASVVVVLCSLRQSFGNSVNIVGDTFAIESTLQHIHHDSEHWLERCP